MGLEVVTELFVLKQPWIVAVARFESFLSALYYVLMEELYVVVLRFGSLQSVWSLEVVAHLFVKRLGKMCECL